MSAAPEALRGSAARPSGKAELVATRLHCHSINVRACANASDYLERGFSFHLTKCCNN